MLRLVAALVFLGLLGCAVPRATPPAAWSAPPGWHALYHRPGFTGRGSLDLRAVGDIMLARNVEHYLRRQPAGWLFARTTELLRGDVMVGNLESPFAAERRPEHLRPGPYRLPADPALAPNLAPFTALSLANNHALDAGPRGLVDTQRILHAARIGALGIRGGDCGSKRPVSAGPDDSIKLHLLAYNAVRDPQDRPDEEKHCGRAWLDEAALEAIAELRRSSGQPIVVLVHWGDEYASAPTAEQRAWAGRLVAAGADLVVGSHPHVLQPAEPVTAGERHGFVAYSLGNFVFDQPDRPETSGSVVLRAWLDRDGVGAIAIAPVAIEDGRPIPVALNSATARAQIAAIAATPPATPQTQNSELRTQNSLRSWRWNGTTFVPTALPAGTVLPPRQTSLDVDLRGDGEPLRATLKDGIVEILDGGEVVWRNEAPAWQVDGMVAGDADNDGRFELLTWLWKPDQAGVPRSHPFLVGWRGGRYRVFWGGSAVAEPIQQAAIGAVNGPRNALVVLEGGARPGDPARHVAVWTWQGWNFERLWQSEPGEYRQLALLDLDDDGVLEIVAW